VLKKHELLRRAYESEKALPCFCLDEDGVVLWANEAAMIAIPQLLSGHPVEQALPGCFPGGFDAEQIGEGMTIDLSSGAESITLTRFHVKRNEDFFLAQYESCDRYQMARADNGRDGMTLMTGYVRQRVNRIFDLISESRGDIQEFLLEHRSDNPSLFQKLVRPMEWMTGAEEDCRGLLCLAMQLEEYYRFPSRNQLNRKELDCCDYFSSLLHDIHVYTLDMPLDFHYTVEPQNESWTISLDPNRYTVALLGLLRVSYISALERGEDEQGGKSSLTVRVRMERDAVMVDIRDTVTDTSQLEKDEVGVIRTGGRVPSPAKIAYENLRRLTEFQNGQCHLMTVPNELGYRLRIRLPAVFVSKNRVEAEVDYQRQTSETWPSSLSSQRGLVQIMFARMEDDMR